MDGFREEIAQKFSAQDMIKANVAAEEQEMNRLRTQVAEYDERLEELRRLNAKNMEMADNLQKMIESGTRKMEEANAEDEGSQEEQKAAQERLAAISAELEANQERVAEMTTTLGDLVHKENVKVYRNVQAVVSDENKALAEKIDALRAENEAKLNAVMKKNKGVKPLLWITLLATLANIGAWVAWYLELL